MIACLNTWRTEISPQTSCRAFSICFLQCSMSVILQLFIDVVRSISNSSYSWVLGHSTCFNFIIVEIKSIVMRSTFLTIWYCCHSCATWSWCQSPFWGVVHLPSSWPTSAWRSEPHWPATRCEHASRAAGTAQPDAHTWTQTSSFKQLAICNGTK